MPDNETVTVIVRMAEFDRLTAENGRLASEVAQLTATIAEMNQNQVWLTQERDRMTAENNELRGLIAERQCECGREKLDCQAGRIERLIVANEAMGADINYLDYKIAQQQDEIFRLNAENTKLRASERLAEFFSEIEPDVYIEWPANKPDRYGEMTDLLVAYHNARATGRE